jgi:hypothetical protein
MKPWPATKLLLLLSMLLPLAGCLLEDSITISNDGQVKFESVVTEHDPQKKMEPAAFAKAVGSLVEDLRQHHWKVEEKWASKERPYRLTVTGSGRLPEVIGATSLYTLWKFNDRKFKLALLTPMDSQVRVVFHYSDDKVTILDTDGKPTHDIEKVSSKELYTIVLK